MAKDSALGVFRCLIDCQTILELIIQLSLCTHRGLVPGPLQMPKSADAQVPYIKWHSTVSPLYPWVLHAWIWKAKCIGLDELDD